MLDRIATLWADGFLAREIGVVLEMPKNSVCRLVFNARASGDPRFPARQKGRGGGNKPVPPAQHPRITELGNHDCRYPIYYGPRHGDHRFCAEPQKPGSSYCPEHTALCYGGGGWRA
jgi:hypothetical protein